MAQCVEIICIGNEILIGKTLNTNAQWIAKRVTSLGLLTCRITVVGDRTNEISAVLQEAIKRNPHFILTTGGLGPTFDDKSIEGLARALGRQTEINEEALEMVKGKYLSYVRKGRKEAEQLTSYRLKMARFPKEAVPLRNPIGTAPAVLVKHKSITIVALPGVPSEMKKIFDDSVAPMMKQAACDVIFFDTSIISDNIMESEMAPLIDKVMQNNPHVYIKSHPKGTELVPHIELHFSTTAKNAGTGRDYVGKALIQLTELIHEKGGKTKPAKLEP